MLSQQVLEAWIQRIEESASARITGNAKDITELACRIDGQGGLSACIDTLVVKQAGNDRTFRELISDNAELGERLAFLTARHNRITEPAAQERNELARLSFGLAERVEKLEKLLERGD